MEIHVVKYFVLDMLGEKISEMWMLDFMIFHSFKDTMQKQVVNSNYECLFLGEDVVIQSSVGGK
jgi:hypothetical protein